MRDFFQHLFSSGGFMPHGHCYFWKPELIWLHVLSDSLIALAYYSIPLTLVYFIRKRRDVPFSWIFHMFGAFIIACGTTHLMEIWSIWHSTYWLSGAVKAVTAALSIATAILLVKLVPQALSLRGPAELEKFNAELESRACELTRANSALREEIAERKRAKEDLHHRTNQFATLLNEAPLGVYIVDGDFRICEVNPIARPVFGNIPDLIGRDFGEVIHILWPKAYADEIVERFRHTLNTGETYIVPERSEERMDRGVTEFYEWQISRIPLPEGRHGVVCYFRDISGRVLAQRQINDSAEQVRRLNTDLERRVNELQAVLDVLPVGVGIARDKQCRDIRMNKAFARTLGLDTEQNASKTAHTGEAPINFRVLVKGRELLPEELPMQVAAAQGIEVRDLEEEIVFADGRTQHVLAYAAPLRDEANQVCGSVGAFVDITERRQAEAARRESEARARAMLESALDCIISVDHQGRIIEFNRAAEGTFGHTRAEALGRSLAEVIIPPALRERHSQAFAKHLTSGKATILGKRVELTALRADGSEFPVELAVTRIPEAEPPAFTAFLRDITVRKQTEAAHAQFAAIVASSDDAIVSNDLDGAMTSWNPGAEKIFGYPAADILGRPMLTLIPPDRMDEEAEILARIARGERIDSFETVRVREDGRHIAVSVTISPIKDNAGRVSGTSRIARDITAKKQAEEQIRASLREKEVMLKEIHHRVKNNLQIVTSLLRLQARTLKNPETIAAFEESCTRVQAMALVHEMLYVSTNFSALDFVSYVRSLTDSLLRAYGTDPAVIRLHLDMGKVDITINQAIPCALILNELVSNSLKYAFPDGRHGEIRLRLHCDPDGTIHMVVGDNGVGLPARMNPDKTESLGLQLVHTLVRQLHGTLELRRTDGIEYAFTFKPANNNNHEAPP